MKANAEGWPFGPRDSGRHLRMRIATALTVILWPGSGPAQSIPTGDAWSYTLTDGSHLIDNCPICDRVDIVQPMRGTFQLRLTSQNPLYSTYAVENILFTAGRPGGREYGIAGHGTYRVGGEVALVQSLSLELTIDDGLTNRVCYFTNQTEAVTRHWPMIQADVAQTNGSLVQEYYLELDAAPFREIWFSTVRGFNVAGWGAPTNQVSAGDLISTTGRIVKRNGDLTARLGIQPPVSAMGLKAVDVLQGGQIAFSLEQDLFSETLGPLRAGDLLSDRGVILRSNSQLVALFDPSAAAPLDLGIGAVQVMDSGEICFSVQTNFFSESLAWTIEPGDLLSDRGQVVRTQAELLKRFDPAVPAKDYGLNSVYVWPSGEIWFSTRDGFYDTQSNYFAGGDLLSDQGYLVYSNAELVSAFAPADGATNLGLDGLFVLTDATPPAAAPTLRLPQFTNQPPASVALSWSAAGRVFQVEKAADPAGPYVPISAPTTDLLLIDPGALTNTEPAFYRLRQW